MSKKKYIPRQKSDKLGRKSHLVILSKKDKAKKRQAGENRRQYLREEQNAGFYF